MSYLSFIKFSGCPSSVLSISVNDPTALAATSLVGSRAGPPCIRSIVPFNSDRSPLIFSILSATNWSLRSQDLHFFSILIEWMGWDHLVWHETWESPLSKLFWTSQALIWADQAECLQEKSIRAFQHISLDFDLWQLVLRGCNYLNLIAWEIMMTEEMWVEDRRDIYAYF